MTSASDDAAATGWLLLDAAAQHEADPQSFPIPPLEERVALHRGDLVKLVFLLDPLPIAGPNAERMWVEVERAHPDGTYAGRLTNEPIVISSLHPSASITFESKHVAGIALRDDDIAFDITLRAVVSAQALTRDGVPGWVGHDTPVSADDSGWSLTAGDEAEGYFEPGKSETMLVLTLGDLVGRYPALVEVFQSGEGEWEYHPEHRRYIRTDRPAH